MKISRLKISEYKNLKDLSICFEEKQSIISFIGNNGSGKSNILEALAIIFSRLSMEEKINFEFELEYCIDEVKYTIQNIDESVLVLKDGKKLKKFNPSKDLPQGIFLYYCGETKRLEEIADSSIDKRFNKALKKDEEIRLKYISLLQLKDFPGALLANALFKTDTYQKISEMIGITNITDNIFFYLKRPAWSKKASISEDSFWNAHGTVANLLHKFKDLGQLRILDNDSAVIQIRNWKSLNKLAENTFDLLKKFKLLMQVDILQSIDINVVIDKSEISIQELSEGEKQLALLLCFLEATKEYKSLFLLDEFDAFLHPSWQRKFIELISSIDIRGQIIFTTHSPLSLTKLIKNQIRIFKDGEVKDIPVDTFNRDSSEVMEEIMEVGLRPAEIQKLIDQFKQAILFLNKEDAMSLKEQLEGKLSEEDPFWVTIEVSMSRFMEK